MGYYILWIKSCAFLCTEMLTAAHSQSSSDQCLSTPSDTDRVEPINKYSIDHSHRSKAFYSCMEYTYRQVKKATLEYLYA